MPLITSVSPEALTSADAIARVIDHTLLKPDATQKEINALCDAALTHGFYAVCVNSHWIPLCAERLKGGQTLPITVVGFPLGATSTASKAFETRDAIARGAREIDMVLNVGELKSGNLQTVTLDVAEVVKAAQGVPVKVILETALLTREEKRLACQACVKAGAAYVKTSTGFAASGATTDDVALMRETVGRNVGVKASGGVRTLEQLLSMIKAGASRVGASSSESILREAADFFGK